MVVLFALSDPTIRYPYIGVQLSRQLPALHGSDPMTVMLSVETGTDMVTEEELQTQEPVVQDEYSLFMILREELKSQTESAQVEYKVERMESEQWAWQEAELNKLSAQTQIFPQKGAQAPKLEYPKESTMASEEVWTPLISSFWPKLPDGLQRAGRSSWQDRVTFKEKHPLTKELTPVNYNLVYRLESFVNTERGLLANIVYVGSITEGSEVDATVSVRGTVKGFTLIEPDTGRAYGGENRIEEKFMGKKPNLPVLRKTTYQGARFWRPMFYKMAQEQPDAQQIPQPQATTEEKAL